MTQEQLIRRKERAKNEQFVVVQTDEGHRVYSPANPATTYLVTGIPESPACTCADFEYHAEEPDWRCKHIIAVMEGHGQRAPVEAAPTETITRRRRPRGVVSPGTSEQTDGPTHMVVKRSVSADGRIDSLSVEIALPIAQSQEDEIRTRAQAVLGIQDRIVAGFRKTNGNGSANGHPAGEPTVPAELLSVGASNTRFGRRLFISVKVNGKTLKLFGSEKQLAEALASAGHPDMTDLVEEGTTLNLPCRVTTKKSDDGKYVNVDRVFPAAEPRH